jgi:chromosomal replication initiation ATPase DnaA
MEDGRMKTAKLKCGCSCGEMLSALHRRIEALEMLHQCAIELPETFKRATPERLESIARLVAHSCGISFEQIRSKQRPEYISRPRQLAFHLQRELTGAAFQEIGKWWNKDHGTVMQGIKRIKGLMETTPSLRLFVTAVRKMAEDSKQP